MALSRDEVIAHGRRELTMAEGIIGEHQATALGTVCLCGRMWECSINQAWTKYANYWRARLAALLVHPVHGPTVVLPLVVVKR